jgi:lipopolysaccharide/colanic/teichoic acid biosynthesis glycosyltransferase
MRDGDVQPTPRQGITVTRALFTTDRWPFLIAEVALLLSLYRLGSGIATLAIDSSSGPDSWFVAACAVIYGSLALGLGSYDQDQRFRIATVVRTTLLAFVITAALVVVLSALSGQPIASAEFAAGSVAVLLGTLAVRIGLRWVALRNPYRFTVVGTSRLVEEAVRHVTSHSLSAGLRIPVPIATIAAEPARPTAAELAAAGLSAVIVAGHLEEADAVSLELACLESGIPAVDEREFYAISMERLPIDDISKRWFLEHGIARPHVVILAIKRLSDVALSTVGLVVLGPFLLAVALAVRVSGPGPVLYVQDRQGRFLRPFRMLKFRTMRYDSNAGTEFTAVSDARVTKVGRVLRRLHADELPQLINILRGDMSVVGPRPELLDFARRMEREVPLYDLRYLARPGLTGHAQLKQGYAMDTAEATRVKLSYDLFYLAYYSLRMDIRILLRTAMFLIRGSR